MWMNYNLNYLECRWNNPRFFQPGIFQLFRPSHVQHTHQGTTLPCKILFSPRYYTSKKGSVVPWLLWLFTKKGQGSSGQESFSSSSPAMSSIRYLMPILPRAPTKSVCNNKKVDLLSNPFVYPKEEQVWYGRWVAPKDVLLNRPYIIKRQQRGEGRGSEIVNFETT